MTTVGRLRGPNRSAAVVYRVAKDTTGNRELSTWATRLVQQAIYAEAKPRAKDVMRRRSAIVSISRFWPEDEEFQPRKRRSAKADRRTYYRERWVARRKKEARKRDHDEDLFPASIWCRLSHAMSNRREFYVLLMRAAQLHI